MIGHEGTNRPLVRAPGWRATTHDLINRPNSSRNAFVLHLATTGVILLSTLFFILESIPDLQSPAWDVLDGIIAVAFTIELVLRFVTAPDGRGDEDDEHGSMLSPFQVRVRLLKQPLVIVDIVAVIPFWFGLIFFWMPSGAFVVLRSLRLVRVLRLLRLAQTSNEMHIFWGALVKSAVAMRLLLVRRSGARTPAGRALCYPRLLAPRRGTVLPRHADAHPGRARLPSRARRRGGRRPVARRARRALHLPVDPRGGVVVPGHRNPAGLEWPPPCLRTAPIGLPGRSTGSGRSYAPRSAA